MNRPDDCTSSWFSYVMIASVGVLLWLASATESSSREADGECIPVCHFCSDHAGANDQSGRAPLARRCIPGCRHCHEVRLAGRKLDCYLLSMGGMDPL